MSLLSSPLHTIRISLLPSSTFLLLSLSRDYSGRWNNFASRRISLSLPLSLFLFYLIPPRFILSPLSRTRRGKRFCSFPSLYNEPCGRVRSSARLSHRVSFSLGGEGGVDLTGLRSRVLLEGKSVLRHFQLRPSPPSVPIHSCTGTWVRGMAVKLRGHAKRHPPPSLPLFPSLFLLRPLSSTPRRLRGFFLSTRLPSPPLLDAGSPRRNWEAKFRGEERSFSERFSFFFFSFEGGEVRIEERKDGVKIVSLHFLARRGLLWRSLDGCKCGWIFFGVCFFRRERRDWRFVWGDMNTTIGASYANCTSESGKEEVVSVFNRGPSN